MDRYWLNQYENKKIVILGFGVEGQSTYKFLRAHIQNIELQIMDNNPDYVEDILTSIEDVGVYGEEAYLDFDTDVDLVFKSPGIPLMHLEGKVDPDKVTSQSNEFIRHYKNHIVGITGTKGKSTTCTFLYELLKAEGVNVELVGNIGKPAFDYIDITKSAPIYIYELSSHQLETVKVSPKVGIILNLFEEHLDHYRSYNHYAGAKLNIARYQNAKDLFIYNAITEEIPELTQGFLGKAYRIEQANSKDKTECQNDGISVYSTKVIVQGNEQIAILEDDEERKLLGFHNLVNMSVGVLVSILLDYDIEEKRQTVIREFEGLSHRLALVTTKNGVTYYNDSISTIPQATIVAIESIADVQTVIVGGMDRGIDYSCLVSYINEHQQLKVILLPDTGHKLYKQLVIEERLYRVDNLEEAVRTASKVTGANKSCVLSPAAPSYGFFKNFEDRGNQFEQMVQNL